MSGARTTPTTSCKSGSTAERIEWIVRPATPEDEMGINKLLKDSYKNLLAANYDAELLEKSLPDLTKCRKELLRCGTWYVVIDPRSASEGSESSSDSNSSFVGCGGWTFHNPSSTEGAQKKVPHLRHFATRSDMTRKGIGKAIWDRSWEEITKQSADGANTTLEVFSTLTAESFYASVGFEKVRELTLPIAKDCDFPCILMKRDPNTKPTS